MCFTRNSTYLMKRFANIVFVLGLRSLASAFFAWCYVICGCINTKKKTFRKNHLNHLCQCGVTIIFKHGSRDASKIREYSDILSPKSFNHPSL